MSQLISVTATHKKAQSRLDYDEFAQTIAIDTDDISGVIRRDVTNTFSYFDINPVKDTENTAKNSSRYNLKVSDALATIASLSTNLALCTVSSRRGVATSYSAIFVVSRMSQYLETVTGLTSTRFWYIEDGDTLPVEYVVTNTIANIIAQTNSSSTIQVRNGLSISGGYVELGANPLIHNTDTDLDQYDLTHSSSYLTYTTLFKRSFNVDYLSIDNGAGQSVIKTADPTNGIVNQYIDTDNAFNAWYSLDLADGFAVKQNNGLSTDTLFRIWPLNPNGAVIESIPTYAYTPVAAGTDRLIGIKVTTGEFFNTGIDPASLAPLASPVFTGNPTAPTPASGDNDTSIATTAFVKDAIDKQPEVIQVAASDELTTLTIGTGKVTFRMPFAMTLTAIRASLTTAQVGDGGGGIFTVDVNDSGVTILSTKLTIDNGEKTSTTAATPPVISDTALADDAEITIDIDQIGDGTATGLKVTLIGSRT